MNTFQYIKQILAHRKRMKIYADALGEYYTGDSHKLIKKVLGWHDFEKLILLPGMIFFFHMKERSPAWQRRARKFYDFLNNVGQFILKRALREERTFCPLAVEWARNLERVLDCLDRNMDPQMLAEFKIKEAAPLSAFLSPEQMRVAEYYRPMVRRVLKISRDLEIDANIAEGR